MDGKVTTSSAIKRPRSRFGIVMRYTSLCYWSVLTFGLLARNPIGLLRGHSAFSHAYAAIEPAVHFLTFALLTLLVLSGSWSVSRRLMLGVIVAYAAMTEMLQGLVPGRTPEWSDLLQNLAGMAAGLAIWWAAARLVCFWVDERQARSGVT